MPRSKIEKLTSMELDEELSATLLSGKYNRTIDGLTETWKIHPPGLPYEPVLQIDLYCPSRQNPQRSWFAWIGNLFHKNDKILAECLAERRNEAETTMKDALLSQQETLSDDWKREKIDVMGKIFRMSQIEGGSLYHGSPAKLEIGSLLKPGHGTRFRDSNRYHVSITSDRDRAIYWTLKGKGSSKGGYVYKIEPLGKIIPHRVGLSDLDNLFILYEGLVPAARILSRSRIK